LGFDPRATVDRIRESLERDRLPAPTPEELAQRPAVTFGDPLEKSAGEATSLSYSRAFQRGYWDKLSFLKMHGLPIE
jgi:hypothetical protein